MTATVRVLPNYPDLSTLESLFSEGPVSFAKLAAEAPRHKNEISHQFCFETFSTDHYVMSDGRRQGTNLTKNKEKDKDKRQKIKSKRGEGKQKRNSMNDIDEIDPLVHKSSSSASILHESEPKLLADEPAKKVPSKPDSEKSADVKTQPKNPTASDCNLMNNEVDASQHPSSSKATLASSEPSENGKKKARKTARDIFRRCECCEREIVERIQLCSGCKKVAYCDAQCQKSHWKQHKKTCTYSQKKEGKTVA